MNEQEAIDFIKKSDILRVTNIKAREAVRLALEALEKQVAKKPYILPISKTDNFVYCPNCKTNGQFVAPSMNYCCVCGQKLEWSKDGGIDKQPITCKDCRQYPCRNTNEALETCDEFEWW